MFDVYNEMIELRRKLRKQREDEIYRRREFKKQIIEFFLILLLICLIGGRLVLTYLAVM